MRGLSRSTPARTSGGAPTDGCARRIDRGCNGEPSASDFIVLELPTIVDRFATDFEGLPEIVEGVPAGPMLITSGCSYGPWPCSA
jgi:hypothetical protein